MLRAEARPAVASLRPAVSRALAAQLVLGTLVRVETGKQKAVGRIEALYRTGDELTRVLVHRGRYYAWFYVTEVEELSRAKLKITGIASLTDL